MNNQWENPLNWVSGPGGKVDDYPGWNGTTGAATTNDVAVFNKGAAAANAIMANPHEIQMLTVTTNFGGTLTLQNSLTINNGGSMANGTIVEKTATANGPITISGGVFTWTGGNINGGAAAVTGASTFTITQGATVVFAVPKFSVSFGDNLVVNTASLLQLSNKGSVDLVNQPTVTNYGHIEITVGNPIGLVAATGDTASTIQNAGEVLMSTAGLTYGIANSIDNTNACSAITVNGGTLEFKGKDAAGFSVGQAQGEITVQGGSTLKGDSGVSQSGGDINVNSGFGNIAGALTVTGGSITIASADDHLRLQSGDFNFTGGTLYLTYSSTGRHYTIRGVTAVSGGGGDIDLIRGSATMGPAVVVDVVFQGTPPASYTVLKTLSATASITGGLGPVPDGYTGQIMARGPTQAYVLQQTAGTPKKPQTLNDQFSVLSGQSLVINAPGLLGDDYDPDGDPLWVSAVNGVEDAVDEQTTLPSGAQLTLNDDGSFTYTPAANWLGADSFTYDVTNGLATATATVTVLTVEQSTQMVVTSNADPVAPGQAVTFTATILGSDGGAPTGSVTFFDGSDELGTADLLAGSGGVQATFTTSSLSPGEHSIIAAYDGDAMYAATTSDPLAQIVSQPTSTTVASSEVPSAPGQSVSFTAEVDSADGGIPTGTVQFLDGDNVLGTATLSAGGGGAQATFATPALSLGDHAITAVYGGDADDAASTSDVLTQTVAPLATSTELSSGADPSLSGQAVTFTMIVVGSDGGQPTGAVTFLDGNTALGTANLASVNGLAEAAFTTSALSVGSHSITAVYGGDSTYDGSTSYSLTQIVYQATSTTLSSNADPSYAGQSVTLSASVMAYGGGTPTGSIQFFNGSTLLATVPLASGMTTATYSTSALSVGSHALTAVYSGDSTFAGGTSSALTQTVQLVQSYTSVSSSLNPSAPGQSVTFTASVMTSGSATGTVSFYDGATLLGTGTLTNGSATFATSSLTAGSHSIQAAYGGDAGHAGSSGLLTQTVQLVQTYTSVSSSLNPSAPGQSVTFTASVMTSGGATGTVSFYDGATLLGTGTLSNSSATFATSALTAGSHSIKAVYNGDAGHASSTSSVLTQTVQLTQTYTSLSSSANTSPFGQPVTFTASIMAGGHPSGTVSFYDGTTLLATVNVSNNTATYTTSALLRGSHSIKAVYSGDADDLGSTSSVLTETIQ